MLFVFAIAELEPRALHFLDGALLQKYIPRPRRLSYLSLLHYMAQAGLELPVILLPSPSECWMGSVAITPTPPSSRLGVEPRAQGMEGKVFTTEL